MSRIMACPGSVQLCKRAPEQPSSPYAEEGTQAHALAEALLLFEPKLPEHTEEMRQAVQVYVDHCDPLIEAADKYGIEAKVVADNRLFGTIDCFALLGSVLYVCDYKHGQGVTVSAKSNKQLLTYAGLIMTDPKTNITYDDVTDVVLTIIQPRGQGQPIDEYRTSIDEVIQHMRDVRNAIKAADSDDPLIAMGSHCRFCRAKLICPAIKKAEQGIAQWDSRDFDPATISELLSAADVIESRITELREYAQSRAEAGDLIPGWKLVEKRSNRRWGNQEKLERFIIKHGLKKKMYKQTLLSPAQAAKVLGDQFESMTHLIEKTVTGTVLVPDDDKREAVVSPFSGLAALGKRAS